MTYRLPFDLTQKPLRKYVAGGVAKFSIQDGRLFDELKRIVRNRTNFTFHQGEIKQKPQLDYLRNLKSFPVRVNKDMEITP